MMETVKCVKCGRIGKLNPYFPRMSDYDYGKFLDGYPIFHRHRNGWVEHIEIEDLGSALAVHNFFCPDCSAESYTFARFNLLRSLFDINLAKK